MEYKEVVERIVSDLAKEYAYELFEVKFHFQYDEMGIEVFIDKTEGNINIAECAYFNRKLVNILDERNVFDKPYNLSVSSPGLDRPLKNKRDFNRVLGEEVTFYLSEKVEGKLQYDGVVKEVFDNEVVVDAKNKNIKILYSQINKAILVLE